MPLFLDFNTEIGETEIIPHLEFFRSNAHLDRLFMDLWIIIKFQIELLGYYLGNLLPSATHTPCNGN